MSSEAWQYIETDPTSPAACEIGELCLFVSQICNCPIGRWVWTGDLPTPDGEDPRPPIFGVVGSRDEGMAKAEEAARHFNAGGLRIA